MTTEQNYSDAELIGLLDDPHTGTHTRMLIADVQRARAATAEAMHYFKNEAIENEINEKRADERGLCRDCKHWDTEPFVAGLTQDIGLGFCNQSVGQSGVSVGGSGEHIVKSDFGCTLWEK